MNMKQRDNVQLFGNTAITDAGRGRKIIPINIEPTLLFNGGMIKQKKEGA